MNYSVLAAESGESALRLVADSSREIDLLLTDVVMPGLNGKQLADRVLVERPAIRVLYMTGCAKDAIVHGGRLDSGVVLIRKPISPSELSRRLRSLLDVHEEHMGRGGAGD